MDTQVPLEIYDVYEIVEHSLWQREWFLCASIGVLGLFFAFLYLWRRRTKVALLKTAVKPWEYARMQLEQLVVPENGRQDEHKKFYSMLTHIVKQYLNQRYSLDEGNTDQELLEVLKKKMINAAALRTLHDIMHHAFTIKFAQHEGHREQMERDKEAACQILILTIPEEDLSEDAQRAV